MMMHRNLGGRMVVVGVSSLLVLTGCASAAKTSAGGGSGGSLTINYWTYLDPNSSAPRSVALKDVIAMFEKSNPKITIKTTVYNYAKLDQQVIQAESAGQGPDVVDIYNPEVPLHISAGSIQSLDKYALPWLKQAGKDYTFALDSLKSNKGQVFALSYEERAEAELWYRADMLKKANVSPPATLSDIATVAGKVHSVLPGHPAGLSLGLSTEGNGVGFINKFLPLVWGFGGTIFDANGKAAFNTDAGVKAIEWFKSVVATGGLENKALSTNDDGTLQDMTSSTAVMAIEGTHRVTSARSGAGVGTNLVTAPFPGTTPGSPFPTLLAGWTSAIGAHSSHPDAAWKFIEFKLSKPAQERAAEAGVLSVLASAYTASSVTPEMVSWHDYLVKDGRMPRYPADWTEFSVKIVGAAQQMIFSGAPVKETLDKLVSDYNSQH